MPKKAPKNAFYFFMLDFKQQQQKKGINYGSLADVAKAADPEWRNAAASVRNKYEAIAKREKFRGSDGIMKFTTTGIPLGQVEKQNKEKQNAIEVEKLDINNRIKLKTFNVENILQENFFLIDVNYLCKADDEYVIGEISILRFNVRDGYRDFLHEIINPGRIPFGYASDVKERCKELGLEMPDDTAQRTNYMQILANIIDYLKQSDKSLETVPPLYTMPDKVPEVKNFIMQLCCRATEEDTLFYVYRLDTMFFSLINAIKTNKNEGFPKESLALLQLKKDPFKYSPKLGCAHHEAVDKSVECTTSRVLRWAFTVLDSCCPILGIELISGQHVPHDYDIEGILTFKDQKKERAAPTVAGFGMASSSCNTTFNDSFNATSTYANCSVASEKPRSKENRPGHSRMRMPQTDYSQTMRPAPELTEDNFPAFSTGAGRGRGLAGNFSKMNIRK